MDARDKGQSGEDMALLLLQKKGYSLLARNFSYGPYEIDLIVQDGETLVFVEVKARTQAVPRLAVDKRKQANICRAALHYAQTTGRMESPMRFDVVEVQRQGGEMRLRHLENAFEFIKGRYFA